jgi:hypothetical protein
MKKIYIIFCIGLFLYSCVCQKVNFEAFTHPYNLEKIPVYSKPNKFYSYLQSDTEAGWVVKIQEQKSGYFYVKLPTDCDLLKKDIWVKSGDIGIVIQNYDSIKIPMYVSADTLSNSIAYIYTSTIGRIYGIKKELVLLSIKYDNKDIQGWVEKKYLCGNPYTTCN